MGKPSSKVRPSLSRRRRVVFSLAALVVGIAIAMVGGELTLRLRHGALFDFEDLRAEPWGFPPGSFAEYDTLLGWVPRPRAEHTWRGGWSARCDEQRLRRNGATGEEGAWLEPPVLAVGDSSAFGDEVEDGESWPAQLEVRLGRRVLNAGMGGYGIDQAVLRAERLQPNFEAPIVVLSLVSDDVTRTAFSFRNRWKPYFALDGPNLTLTPAPSPDVPLQESPWLVGLGHSHLAQFVLERGFPTVWMRSTHRRVHHDEREVSGRLLVRLNEFVEARGAHLLVVFLVGGDADGKHLPDLLARATEGDVTTLDLSDQLARWARDPVERKRRFARNYHLSPEGNAWVSERVADRLRELGWI